MNMIISMLILLSALALYFPDGDDLPLTQPVKNDVNIKNDSQVYNT